MSEDTPTKPRLRPRLTPSKTIESGEGIEDAFSFSADFNRLLELPMDDEMRQTLLQTVGATRRFMEACHDLNVKVMVRPSPWGQEDTFMSPQAQTPNRLLDFRLAPMDSSSSLVMTQEEGQEEGGEKKEDLLLTKFRMAEAEAEAEELSDRLRVMEFEADQSSDLANQFFSDKEAFRNEIKLLKRELEVAKKERDDAIGEKYLSQKEAKRAKEIAQLHQETRARGGSSGLGPAADIQRLEGELVDLKVKLADACAKIVHLEKEKEEAVSSAVEMKYELARARCLLEDKEAEVEQLKERLSATTANGSQVAEGLSRPSDRC